MTQKRTRLLHVAAVSAAAMMALAGCSGGAKANKQAPVPAPRAMTSTMTETTPAPAQPAARHTLTRAQEVGQRIIYSYPGATPPANLLNLIKAGQVAGVIFFGENITSSSQIAGVIKQLNAANAQSPVKEPLLLMTDQEGGKVRRLPGAPDNSAKQDGAAADPVTTSREAGKGAGQNLASVGMNLNLAPVLDVYRKDGDFADSAQRSFSKDPAQVGADGSAFVQGQQEAGVPATVKHFPGLGSASVDENTDNVPVTLDVPLNTLRSVDEAPYPKAFAAGAKVVMTSWAVYPALDPNRPAGLSSKVIGDELRGRLGFQGVTISDALEAGALKAYGGSDQRGVDAAQAGIDLILASARDVNQGQQVASGLSSALSSGKLDQAQFDASVSRISSLRQGLAH